MAPLRFFLEVIEGLATLRENAARSVTTVLGMAWGTFAVVGLAAFSTGIEERMAERSAGLGEGILIAWPARTTKTWRGLPEGRALRILPYDVRALAGNVPHLAELSPEFSRYEKLRRGARAFRPEVSGVDPDYGALRNLHPQPGGRFLNPVDLAERRRVVFLGDVVAEQLFENEQALGRTVVLGDAPFTVVGVLKPKDQDSDYGSTDDLRIFIPTSTFTQIFGDRYIRNFVLRADHPDRLPAVMNTTFEILGRRLGFDPADRAAFSMWDTTEDDRITGQAFDAMDLLMLMAGTFTVLVGAIGLGNLMFLVVRRRTGEIGLRMALGSRPSWVMRQILGEALVLVAIGGLLGFLAAAGLAALVAASPLAENLGRPRISPALALGVALLLGMVGLLAGWFPARRASRLDPAMALAEAR